MYGDMMYCKTCGSVFKDTWHVHDTRIENQLITNCPQCLSIHTMNADAFIDKYEKQETQNRYSFDILYHHLKLLQADYHIHKYNVKLADVYITEKERENSNRKF